MSTSKTAPAPKEGQRKAPGQVDGSPYIRRPQPSSSQQSLQLEWAFGLHKDFKGVIHNLSGSVSTASSTAAGAASSSQTASGAGQSLSGSLALGRRRGMGATTTASTTTTAANNTEQEQRRVFYPLAHVGVLYDVIQNSQKHLLGHTYTIVASCCSHNHRFLVTADEGDADAWPLRNTFYKSTQPAAMTQTEDMVESAEQEARMFVDPAAARLEAEDDGSTMIVWDATTGLPVRTIPVGKYGGVVACAMSPDGQYIATINRRTPQEVMIWGWTVTEEEGGETETGTGAELAPEFVRRIPSQDEQTCIRFALDNPHLLCTNGLRRVMFWSWAEGKLKYYSPPILQRDLKVPVGNLTQTILVPGTSMACSGTVDGDVVLWELQPRDRIVKDQDKMMYKMVRVHTGGITFLTYESGYIVTGGMDGHVKFLDSKLRLMAWFEELNAGPIISISFDRPSRSLEENLYDTARLTQRHAQVNSTAAASEFTAPDFMVSTANAMVIDVPAKSFHTHHRSEIARGKLIVQGQDQALLCVAAHPKLPRVAIAGLSGNLHLWDYEQKRVLMLCIFQSLLVQSMAFDPTGTFLSVGFTNGSVKVLDAESLEDRQTFKPKRTESVLRMCFSEDGRMMATGTSEGMVGLYEYAHPLNDPARPLSWECIGHHKTHRAPICGLQFGHNTNGEAIRLLSVGEDKRLIEYNLVESDVESGLVLRTAHKITQGPIPTGFVWSKVKSVLDPLSRPRQGLDVAEGGAAGGGDFALDGVPMVVPDADRAAAESGRGPDEDPALDYLLIATNEYKISVYLSDWSRQCVKTVLAPTFGGPVTAMAVVPARVDRASGASTAASASPGVSSEKCLVYVTGEKVIGLMQLPLLGDPCASMGLLAHPGAIKSFAVSHDGAYLFTAGGEDQSVLQWRVDGRKIMADDALSASPEAAPAKGTDKDSEGQVPLDHLIAAIEGGAEGALMKEIMDYFYYAQIRAQGEETSAKRALLGAIPFAQMPNLMRALGYYPTELEIGHLTYEVANTHGPRDADLAELDVDAILLSFAQFMQLYVNHRPVFGITRQDIEHAFTAIGANPATGEIGRDAFFQLLCARGEPLRAVEVTAALTSLLGDGVRVDMLEDNITARAFAENLLGFEDYDGVDNGDHSELGDDEEDDDDLFEDEDAYN